jgi:hypothetical protein
MPRYGSLAANAQEPSGQTVVGASCVSGVCKCMYVRRMHERYLKSERLDRRLGMEIDVQLIKAFLLL